MTGAKSLPPFCYDWVGGDIRGLQALDDECDRVATRINDADHALARQVTSVVGAGGWTGRAADSFTSAWDRDSEAGVQLTGAWQKIGEIAATLAADLAALENALEGAAYQLEKQGIAVDTATGTPVPGVTAGGNACPDPQTAAARGKLASDYMAYRTEILNQAAAARTHATYALYTVTAELLPPGTDWGQLANDLDGVRGLWATPTEYRRELEEELADLKQEGADVTDELWQRALAEKLVNGNNFRLPRDLVEKGAEARQAIADQEAKLADAPPEGKLGQLADGDADGLGLAGLAGTTVRAIPFAGATIGAGIQIYQDKEDHESWRHAVVDGVASNGAGLAAGIGVAGLIGSGSVVAVAGGAVLGGIAAVGVGDAVHNLIQEHWAADWHKYGVLDGTAHGVVDSLDKTRHDLAHYGDDILHLF
jgi:hypothetical protein